jgi:hypothetical protein
MAQASRLIPEVRTMRRQVPVRPGPGDMLTP